MSDPSAPSPALAPLAKSAPAPASTPSTSNTSELTPAQKKALAKAEKAARRAEKVTAKEAPATPTVAAESSPPKTNGVQPPKQSKAVAGKAQDVSATTTPKARRPSVIASGVQVRDLPERLRRETRAAASETKKTVNKEVAMFSHLYNQPRKHTLEGSAREVHPAVLELGLQLSSYVICGSQARCIAMLLALKSVRLPASTTTLPPC